MPWRSVSFATGNFEDWGCLKWLRGLDLFPDTQVVLFISSVLQPLEDCVIQKDI